MAGGSRLGRNRKADDERKGYHPSSRLYSMTYIMLRTAQASRALGLERAGIADLVKAAGLTHVCLLLVAGVP